MSKKEKKSKHESHSRKYESESDSSSSGSSASYSGSYSSESEEERVPVKKPKLDSSSKKRQKKERKRQEKKKQKKTENKISKEDFFGKSVEFRLWLMEEKKVSMEDMKTSKAKAYFKKFVKRWNGGKLPKKYYKGIDAADAKASLTKYKWKFAEKLQASDGPPSSSNSPFTAGGQPLQRATFSTFGKISSPEISKKGLIGPEKPILGPQRPPHLVSAQYEEEEDPAEVKARLRAERKKLRDDDKLVMEELAPKASGHEAKIEKKLLRRQRGGSPEVSDRVLMGSGMDIDTIMAKKRKSDAARRERNTELASIKLAAYQEKEKAKMQALLEMARANKSKDALW